MGLTDLDVASQFAYENGSLIRVSNGKPGYRRPDGYVYTRINGRSYGEHRLIFLLFHGWLPEQVDHINGDNQDNKIENLRAATHSQNCQNRKPMGSTSKGCYWQPKRGKWIAQIGFDGKRITIGYFDTEACAAQAYAQKAKELHGEFRRVA